MLWTCPSRLSFSVHFTIIRIIIRMMCFITIVVIRNCIAANVTVLHTGQHCVIEQKNQLW